MYGNADLFKRRKQPFDSVRQSYGRRRICQQHERAYNKADYSDRRKDRENNSFGVDRYYPKFDKRSFAARPENVCDHRKGKNKDNGL